MVEGTVAAPRTLGTLTVDGADEGENLNLHRDMTIGTELKIIDDGDLDLSTFDLTLTGDYTQTNAAGTIINTGAEAGVRFGGANNQAITLLADWVVKAGLNGYTLGVNKTNLTTAATVTGGDIDFATNGETLYLDEGILATSANDAIILQQQSDVNADQGSLNTQPTQGFKVGAGKTSFVAGNVKKYISPFDADANIHDDDGVGVGDDYDASIALTRVEFPVGSLPASPGYDRLFAISFNTLPTAATNLTVSHSGSKAPGTNGFPIDAGAFQITNMANFHWKVESDITLQAQVKFDIEARAAGYEADYTTDEVEDIRFVRRFDNNDDNPWELQGATGYDNSTDNVKAQSVVIAKDAVGAISSQGAVFTYSQNNKPPQFTVAPATATVDEGQELTLTYKAEEVDLNDTFTLTVADKPEAATFVADGDSLVVTWTPSFTDAGLHNVVIRGTDSYGDFADTTTVVTVNDVNALPVFADVPGDTVEVSEGSVYTFTLTATDADTDNSGFTYTLQAPVDSVKLVDSTGVLTFSPAYGEEGVTKDVTIFVTDGNGGQDTTNVHFVVIDQNRAPEFTTAMSDTSVDEGALLTLDFGANVTDLDGDTLTYSFELWKEGVAVDTLAGAIDANGVYTWTPSYAQAGVYTLVAIASDDLTSGTDTVAVTVNNLNAPPTWVAELANDTVYVGDTLTFTYVAEDLDMDDITYAFVGNHPADATLDPATGVFSWAPQTASQFPVLIKVSATDGTAPAIQTQAEITIEVITVEVAGVVAYDNMAMDPIKDAHVMLMQGATAVDTVMTDSTGAYKFTNVSAGDYSVVVSSEAMWPSNAVLASDALLAARSAVDTTVVLSAMQKLAGDVTGDDVVNAFDALQILQRVVKLTSSFAVADWQFEAKDVTVGTSNVAADIKAIATGDVDASYAMANALAKNEVSVTNEEALRIAPKAEFELPIKLDAASEVSAFTFRFAYPAEKMELVSVGSKAKGLAHSAKDGVLSLAWADLTGKNALVVEDDAVVVLKFKATEEFAKSEVAGLTLELGEVVNELGKDVNASVSLQDAEIAIPETFALNQNYPNPFNPTTTIAYDMPIAGKVTLKVFNTLGQEVTTLVNEVLEAGSHKATFNATNMASGIYFFNITVEGTKNFVQTKKMVLLK
jgi:hypothetical protein